MEEKKDLLIDFRHRQLNKRYIHLCAQKPFIPNDRGKELTLFNKYFCSTVKIILLLLRHFVTLDNCQRKVDKKNFKSKLLVLQLSSVSKLFQLSLVSWVKMVTRKVIKNDTLAMY